MGRPKKPKLPRDIPSKIYWHNPPLPVPQYIICFHKWYPNFNNGEWSESWDYRDWNWDCKPFTETTVKECAESMRKCPDEYRDVHIFQLKELM